MTADLIVNACLTGMIASKADNPDLPVTPEEIIRDALAVYRLGASIVHLHARGSDGLPTWSGEVYGEIIRDIRAAAPELIICATTSARNWGDREKRSAVLELGGREKPDMASLTLGSLNFQRGAALNTPEDILYLLDLMNERGIRPEIEIFDLGMLDQARHLMKKGRLRPPFYFNFILGNLGTADARPATLAFLVDLLPQDSVWAASGIGKNQFRMNCLALAFGGHVRVGLEDNLRLGDDRSAKSTNAAQVSKILEVAYTMDRTPMAAAGVRRLLGL